MDKGELQLSVWPPSIGIFPSRPTRLVLKCAAAPRLHWPRSLAPPPLISLFRLCSCHGSCGLCAATRIQRWAMQGCEDAEDRLCEGCSDGLCEAARLHACGPGRGCEDACLAQLPVVQQAAACARLRVSPAGSGPPGVPVRGRGEPWRARGRDGCKGPAGCLMLV